MSYAPIVSVIIPCYNHGQYIVEAIESVEKLNDKSAFEIIIVNDGSTDDFTNNILKCLSSDYTVIQQENKGLAATRNAGISIAKGKYILPLDADNKIDPLYITKSIQEMDNNPEIDIVYSDAHLFGDTKNALLLAGPFNLQRLMLGNYIDACACFRKDVWIKNKGYDEALTAILPGLEDWEFWMHAAFNGFSFQYINEPLFYYRIVEGSMLHQLKKKKAGNVRIIEYLIQKHEPFFGPQYIDEDIMKKVDAGLFGFVGKIILKKYFPATFERLVHKGKLRRYI